LIGGLSIADILQSITSFLGSWPIPRDFPYTFFAYGTTQTCTAAGFFAQLNAPCLGLYNSALALYYLLEIKYRWPTAKIVHVEWVAHIVIWCIGLGTAIAGIFLNLYNPLDGWICYISEYPPGCLDSLRHDGSTTCERGDNAWIYLLLWFFVPGWFSFVCQVTALTIVYREVLRQERMNERFVFADHDDVRRRNRSNAVFGQALWYGVAFCLTWMFPTISKIAVLVTGQKHVALGFLSATFYPLQGFWNWIIYNRPKYVMYVREHPRSSVWNRASFAFGISQSPESSSNRGEGASSSIKPSTRLSEDVASDTPVNTNVEPPFRTAYLDEATELTKPEKVSEEGGGCKEADAQDLEQETEQESRWKTKAALDLDPQF
jgi:hypothetical protein